MRYLLSIAVSVCVVQSVAAQRGGRGPSEEILKRSGSYFIDVSVPEPGEPDAKGRPGKIPLEQSMHVVDAAKAGHLSLLYLYDARKNEQKHEQFEQTIFGHAEISVLLRAYRCGRVDLGKDRTAADEFYEAAPMFAAFTDKGELAGIVEFGDYRAKGTPLITLLEKAARGHAKLTLPKFVKEYRDFLNDYQVWEGRKRTLEQKRSRITQDDNPSDQKLREVDKEMSELDKERDKMLEHEQELLERAGIPERDPKAVRLGDRRRGR